MNRQIKAIRGMWASGGVSPEDQTDQCKDAPSGETEEETRVVVVAYEGFGFAVKETLKPPQKEQRALKRHPTERATPMGKRATGAFGCSIRNTEDLLLG